MPTVFEDPEIEALKLELAQLKDALNNQVSRNTNPSPSPAGSYSPQAIDYRQEHANNFREEARPRNWRWYQNLRRSNPRKYYDAKSQRELLEDRHELGGAFYQ